MTMVAEQTERKVAERQAVALLNLSPKQVKFVHELRDLFHKSVDQQERNEIIAAFLEVTYPRNIAVVGDVNEGVSRETKGRVNAYHKRIGIEIKRRRQKAGMTQDDLAAKAGIPQSHVSRLERGKHAPTYLTIKKIAKALKTRPRMIDPGFDE